jgi:hypothetical protein
VNGCPLETSLGFRRTSCWLFDERYRKGAKEFKVLRPTFRVIENIEFGLRMTNLGGLFLCERPLHHVILRPTLVIQPS